MSACFPARETFLKPSAPGGRHVNSTCGGVAGPRDRLVLASPSGVMVGVETFSLKELSDVLRARDEWENRLKRDVDQRPSTQPRRTGTGLSIILHVPTGRSLRFGSRSFVITDQRTGTVHEREPSRVFSDSGVLMDAVTAGMVGTRHSPIVGTPLDIGDALIGKPDVSGRLIQRWFGTKVSRPFYIVIEADDVKCEDCLLRLPPMLLDSTPVEFPEIRLRPGADWFITGLNC